MLRLVIAKWIPFFVCSWNYIVCQRSGRSEQYAGPTELLSLDATCGPTAIHVLLNFAKPFDGTIYSKGAFYKPECVYVPAGSGRAEYAFDIPLAQCGTEEGKPDGGEAKNDGTRSFENTLVLQNDVQFQDITDIVRRLRCTTAAQYEKVVGFAPINVDTKDVVTATFTSDDVRVSIDIQTGRGPFSKSLNQGFIQIGDVVTLVIYMAAGSGLWDMHVRECIAQDSQERATLMLQDKAGCIAVPKLISPFSVTRDKRNPKIQIAYAFMKAFRFPDDMQVQIKCVVAVCRDQCERPATCGSPGRAPPLFPAPSGPPPPSEPLPPSGPPPPEAIPDENAASVPGVPGPPLRGWGPRPQNDDDNGAIGLARRISKRQARLPDRTVGTLPVKRVFNVISAEDIANLGNSSIVLINSATAATRKCVDETIFIALTVLLIVLLIGALAVLTVACLKNWKLEKMVKMKRSKSVVKVRSSRPDRY